MIFSQCGVCVCVCVPQRQYKNEPSGACVALTLDIACARCVTAPSLLALCDCISSNFHVFPSSAVLFGCLCCPFGTQTHSLSHSW